MNINITLIGQMITFAIFVWFTMKFVWPPVITALKERQSKIADGLAAAERGHKELKLSQSKATDQIRYARREANEIVEQANKRAAQIIEQAKEKAREEGARQLVLAKEEINQEVNHAKQALRQQVASVAIAGAEKILGRSIDAAANSDLLDKLVKEI